ncbi:two-component sensor histidine kinase [Sphingomonas jejuensis]|uniref:histidine kinase n=1 Tax=Sphingomonas jejuensis TaxID=904715 RepID=A0ABX0XNG9_9SPHN|nr:two-component sensor histidine kinase [Sphingomonas jejuensis]
MERLPIARSRPVLSYLAAVLLVAFGAGLRVLVDHALPPGYPFFTFFPMVALTAFLFGLKPGMLAALLSGLISWYFFVTPGTFGTSPQTLTAMAFYLLVVGVELTLIHFMQVANNRLERARVHNAQLAATSELLFRELQHRVSNNLQVAAGLLTLQRQKLADQDARGALDQAARRLGLIGRISRNLYDPSGEASSLDTFLTTMVDDLLDAHGRSDIDRRVDCAHGTRLHPDAAVSVALIVAEAVANAVEHGLAGRDEARILVRVVEEGAQLSIQVEDNGIGVPEAFDVGASSSLGLKIATTLAETLDGRFRLSAAAGGGTVARLQIPR